VTYNEKLITIRAMKRYGGSFVKALAEAFLLSDEANEKRIEAAFHDYMIKYGPGSDMFSAIAKEPA
jgi:hypothetical protein